MRSAFNVFSSSISAPQMAMILSASLDAAAATHGAGWASGSVEGSVPVADALRGDAAHMTEATVTFRTSVVKHNRIDLPSEPPLRLDGRAQATLARIRAAENRGKLWAI